MGSWMLLQHSLQDPRFSLAANAEFPLGSKSLSCSSSMVSRWDMFTSLVSWWSIPATSFSRKSPSTPFKRTLNFIFSNDVELELLGKPLRGRLNFVSSTPRSKICMAMQRCKPLGERPSHRVQALHLSAGRASSVVQKLDDHSKHCWFVLPVRAMQ